MHRFRTSRLRAIYWALTLLFMIGQGWSAVQYLVEAPRMSATILGLGYPAYFMMILGVAKLLGIAAIATGVSPTLKEWAYAGFTFDVCGAFASHLSVGDPPLVLMVPVVFLLLQLGSYAAWRQLSRQQAARRRRYPPTIDTRELVESSA